MGLPAARRAASQLALLALVAGLNVAFAVHATLGTPVADAPMPAAGGGEARALGDADASVIVFFRLGQERSVQALRQLSACQAAFAGKSVHWAAVVSDDSPPDKAAALAREARFAGAVLVDRGDALYASLGIALHPVLVLVDRQKKLAAFEPFRSVNFCEVVTARIRHLLREITDEQLRAALDPPASPAAVAGGGAGARYRALSESLLSAGNLDKAIEAIAKSLAADPAQARSHAVHGDILRAKGDCVAAATAYAKALALEPAHAAALEGAQRCKGGR